MERRSIMKNGNTNGKENGQHKAVIRVDGMMCPHCEATVVSELEKLDFILTAEADHKKGIVSLSLNGELQLDAVRTAVEGKGYTFGGIVS